MFELVDALFLQRQRRQSVVKLRKCIIPMDSTDIDSNEAPVGSTSGKKTSMLLVR